MVLGGGRLGNTKTTKGTKTTKRPAPEARSRDFPGRRIAGPFVVFVSLVSALLRHVRPSRKGGVRSLHRGLRDYRIVSESPSRQGTVMNMM